MATTIKIRNSATPGATPASLKQGEFAINVADGRLFYGSGSVDVVKEFTGVGIDTGSFATTGSNTFVGNQYIVGDITASVISASYIDLDVLANGDIPAHKAGRIFFGAEDGALEVYNEEADITLQVGQEFWVRVYNPTASPIANGTPVRASGSQGDRIRIYPAVAEDHTAQSVFENHILGMTTHEIEAGTEGYVTSQGIVRGVDTSAFSAGDILFLQTGSAGFRNTPPPFPYDIVQVGYVARSASPNGFIFVQPKEPVHFNVISGLSGSSVAEPGDLFIYQANNAWTPGKTLSGSYTIDNGNLNVQGNITASIISASFVGTFQQITGITITSQSWGLTGSIYSSSISNANINSNTVVDVIPDNADYTIVLAAQLLPQNASSAGEVTVFAVNEPTDDINVTLNLFK
jgi:hypothetical protein